MVDFSKPVQTRDGYPVRVLCTDMKRDDEFTVLVLINKPQMFGEFAKYYRADGTSGNKDVDLINVPTKKYLNLYSKCSDGTYYDSREIAENHKGWTIMFGEYIRTIEVEV